MLNILVLFTFDMGDQDHDSLFSSIMLKSIDNQISIALDQATPSKKWQQHQTSIIEKEIYTDKKCDKLAKNSFKQEILREIKHYISCLQQDNKTDYMDEYVKATQDQIAPLKIEITFIRGEIKGKKSIHWTTK